MNLDPRHLSELHASALSDRTIAAAGVYTSCDAAEVAKILNWRNAKPSGKLLPAMVIPFPGADGKPNGYSRIKFTTPRRSGLKYESPVGKPNRLYFTPRVLRLADGDAVCLTEGEKKSLCLSQLGVPAIGLVGPFGWQLKRTDEAKAAGTDRQLLPDFDGIDWDGRSVVLIFDADDELKPMIELGVSELTRILTNERGARVRRLWLPLGPRDAAGRHQKQAVDDWIAADGPRGFKALWRDTTTDEPVLTLTELRQQLPELRVASIGHGGVYLDRSCTGAGKSVADVSGCRLVEKSLVVVDSHSNCAEVEERLQAAGLDAVAFPPLNEHTCKKFKLAKRVIGAGLGVMASACLTCKYATGCGYLALYKSACDAPHKIATHRRAQMQLKSLSRGARYVSLHEDAIGMLRPIEWCSRRQLQRLSRVAWEAGRDCDAADRFYYDELAMFADRMLRLLTSADGTVVVELPAAIPVPHDTHHHLFRTMLRTKKWTHAAALRMCQAALAGTLESLVARVEGTAKKRRRLLGVWTLQLPKRRPVWINDATCTRNQLESVLGVAVHDRTPAGRVEMAHPIVQVPVDVTRQTKPDRALAILNALRLQLRDFDRFGVICHATHRDAIGNEFGPLAMIDHFGGTTSRGSNEWIEDNAIDCLIVLGTPRTGQTAVGDRLVLMRRLAALGHDPKWTTGQSKRNPNGHPLSAWPGVTPTGRVVTVRNRTYLNHDWREAFESLTHAELKQAVGRGRSALDDGVPVVVCTNENLGYLVAENVTCRLETLIQTTNYVSSSLDNMSHSQILSSTDFAKQIGLSNRHAIRILTDLQKRGLAEHVSKSAGWRILPMPQLFDTRTGNER